MGLFIYVQGGPDCPLCGEPIEWQSKQWRRTDGVAEEPCQQHLFLERGITAEIHGTCDDCGTHYEIGIERSPRFLAVEALP